MSIIFIFTRKSINSQRVPKMGVLERQTGDDGGNNEIFCDVDMMSTILCRCLLSRFSIIIG